MVELFIEHYSFYSNFSYLLLHPFLKDIFLHLDYILSMSVTYISDAHEEYFRVYATSYSFLYPLQTSVICLPALPVFQLERLFELGGGAGGGIFGVLMTLTFVFLFGSA